MTPLANWMKTNGKTDQWLAEQIGRDRTSALRIRRGQSIPPLPIAVVIERVTNGAVTANDFLPSADAPRPAPPTPSTHGEAA